MGVWVNVEIEGEGYNVCDVRIKGYECICWENETDIEFCDDDDYKKDADLVVEITNRGLLVARAWFRRVT